MGDSLEIHWRFIGDPAPPATTQPAIRPSVRPSIIQVRYPSGVRVLVTGTSREVST